MNRWIPTLVIGMMSLLASEKASAQFTPLVAVISVESDGTIYRTVNGETLGCLAPPGFTPSPNIAYARPLVGDVVNISRTFDCEDVTLYVEQRIEVLELEDLGPVVRPSKVNVRTTSHLSYDETASVRIKIGEDVDEWDLTTGEFWIGHPVRNQPGVQFANNHFVDTVNTTFERP